MLPSAGSADRGDSHGLTLVELVITIAVSGILAGVVPPLILQGVQSLVFLPRALVVDQAAVEIMHQLVEGGFSTLTGQTTIPGLRFATKRNASEPALWLADTTRIGFVTSTGQYILVRLVSEAVKRSALSGLTTCTTIPGVLTEETLPYDPSSPVRILTTGVLFLYYDSTGSVITPLPTGCPPATTIRRVDIAFTAQTGSGVFDQGQAHQDLTTSVAIRAP